jgi:hypothetical protein
LFSVPVSHSRAIGPNPDIFLFIFAERKHEVCRRIFVFFFGQRIFAFKMIKIKWFFSHHTYAATQGSEPHFSGFAFEYIIQRFTVKQRNGTAGTI